MGEGLVVTTDAQTAGRGKPGSLWVSPPAVGLYLSVIIKPRQNPNDLTALTQLGAVAVVKLIKEQSGLEAIIKQPNDVLLNGKKICGILTERLATGEVIMGIGVNLNNPTGSFPPELTNKATSLLIESGKTWPTVELRARLIELLDHEYLAYLKGI